MKLLTFAMILMSASAQANPAQYVARIALSAQDSVQIQFSIAGVPAGKTTSLQTRVESRGDEAHGILSTCVSEAQFEGAMVGVSVLDSGKNLLAQKTQISKLSARTSYDLFQSNDCRDTLPRDQPVSFMTYPGFTTLMIPYKGAQVELALELPIGGTVTVDAKGNFNAVIDPASIHTVHYFVNNGNGVDGAGGAYARGNAQVIDPSKPVQEETYDDRDW